MPLAVVEEQRIRRHRRVRKKVVGTPDRPRLVVHRSGLHLDAQLIDDTAARTLVGCTTRARSFREIYPKGGDQEAAKRLGEIVAEAVKKAGIQRVVFDRGGCRYHGRVKAFLEAAKAHGLGM